MDHLPPFTLSNIFEIYPSCFGSHICTRDRIRSYENQVLYLFILKRYIKHVSHFSLLQTILQRFFFWYIFADKCARISETTRLKLLSKVATPVYIPTSSEMRILTSSHPHHSWFCQTC